MTQLNSEVRPPEWMGAHHVLGGVAVDESRWSRVSRSVGLLPPQRLGIAYGVVALVLDMIATFLPGLALGAGLLALGLLLGLIAVVAFLRDDDPLEAGLLIALITSVAALASQVLIAAIKARSIAPIVMTLPGAFLGVAFRGLIWGIVGAGVVWVLRRVRGKPTADPPKRGSQRPRF